MDGLNCDYLAVVWSCLLGCSALLPEPKLFTGPPQLIVGIINLKRINVFTISSSILTASRGTGTLANVLVMNSVPGKVDIINFKRINVFTIASSILTASRGTGTLANVLVTNSLPGKVEMSEDIFVKVSILAGTCKCSASSGITK